MALSPFHPPCCVWTHPQIASFANTTSIFVPPSPLHRLSKTAVRSKYQSTGYRRSQHYGINKSEKPRFQTDWSSDSTGRDVPRYLFFPQACGTLASHSCPTTCSTCFVTASPCLKFGVVGSLKDWISPATLLGIFDTLLVGPSAPLSNADQSTATG